MEGDTKRRKRGPTRFLSIVATSAMLAALLPAFASPASAAPFPGTFTEPIHVSAELEGCHGSVTSGNYIDNPYGDGFICVDAEYTNGNLGKGWNELDLVPHRLTTSLGTQTTATTTYNLIVAADNTRGAYDGYDFISPLVINAAKSDDSCAVVSYDQQEIAGITGGVDDAIYRVVQITQDKGTTCVFDYVERLSITSADFSGSSLQSYMFESANFTTGKRTVPIPVGDVLPQALSKTMTATQGSEYVWAITKTGDATVTIANTCDDNDGTMSVTISWTRIGPNPSGMITVVTTITATNPSHRDVGVVVTDKIYGRPGGGAEQLLDTKTFGTQATPIVVDAGMTETIGIHTFQAAAGTTGLRDVATAKYYDLIFPDVEIPGTNTAEASATVEASGVVKNATAVITDVESISGTGLSFSVDSKSGASGSFSGGYALGQEATSVTWVSGVQSGNGSVTFNKTIYATTGLIGSGEIDDTATLVGSDGFTTDDDWTTDINVDTTADLEIDKTIPNVLQTGETVTFTFDVKDAQNTVVRTETITFTAGQTSKSVMVENLDPAVYTVVERPLAGWKTQASRQVDLTGAACEGMASFENAYVPPSAKVKKVTVPVGFAANWTFNLYREAGAVDELLETVVTTGTGFMPFTEALGEGSYYITEVTQAGWTSDGGSASCAFTVNLPADAGRVFECTFTNTYVPSLTLDKSGDELSKGGDEVHYSFVVQNTGSTGGAAGVPSLSCVVTDTTIGYTSSAFTLAAGATKNLGPIAFTIPMGNYDDESFLNEATVNCTYVGLSAVVASADSDFTTDLFHPSIEVTKSGPTYALVGDVVTYTVTIENTSDLKTPDLVVKSVVDTKAGTISVPSAHPCYELADGETCTLTYTYTVPSSAGSTVNNRVDVEYNPKGFSNPVTDWAQHTLTVLRPSFTITKACSSTEPVPQEGPANFTVTVSNTGNAALVLTVGDGIGTVNLAVGQTKSFTVTINGPFAGSATVANSVSATASLDPSYTGVAWSDEKSANATCRIGSKVKVEKTFFGVPDPTIGIQFQLYTGPDGFDQGTLLTSKTTLGDADGVLEFSQNLDPTKTYTMCERNLPAGWTATWMVNGAAVTPYNPDADNAVPEDLGNRCVDFGHGTSILLTAGGTLVFKVDNEYPKGEARTPGYWKNWNTCTGGRQAITAEKNGGWEEGFWLLDDLLPQKVGNLNITTCQQGVKVLNAVDWATGKKMSSDAAYLLARNLLAAQLNVGAGASHSAGVDQAIIEANALLAAIGFDGSGTFLKAPSPTRADALAIAKYLDMYNNNFVLGPYPGYYP